MSDEQTVILKSWDYSLDWFVVKDRKVKIAPNIHYTMQFRLGAWYLSWRTYDHEKEKWENCMYQEFRLDNPVDAVIKLGKHIYEFSKMHNEPFSDELLKLMKNVELQRTKIKGGTE